MASRKVFTFSAATLSWIDPRSRLMGLPLPENDPGGEPREALTFQEITSARICRFSHLLTCSIVVEDGRIVHREVARESGLYARPSFLDTPPRIYPTRRDFTSTGAGQAIFAQTVGCRTQAPEILGAAAGQGGENGLPPLVREIIDGWRLGREAAELLSFPPIWTTLYLNLLPTGICTGLVRAHSLFPSMTYYEARASGPSVSTQSLIWRRQRTYDAVPFINAWRDTGWGRGNPWRIQSPAGVSNESIR